MAFKTCHLRWQRFCTSLSHSIYDCAKLCNPRWVTTYILEASMVCVVMGTALVLHAVHIVGVVLPGFSTMQDAVGRVKRLCQKSHPNSMGLTVLGLVVPLSV